MILSCGHGFVWMRDWIPSIMYFVLESCRLFVSFIFCVPIEMDIFRFCSEATQLKWIESNKYIRIKDLIRVSSYHLSFVIPLLIGVAEKQSLCIKHRKALYILQFYIFISGSRWPCQRVYHWRAPFPGAALEPHRPPAPEVVHLHPAGGPEQMGQHGRPVADAQPSGVLP